ncbi:hypothetical protein [Spectribacter hydrogenoxidans]|uniref:Uncharacterized protein n=1 Tax=Spectribacter hydrogenoxidans TaxID=3075608 RepID=A0ABU3C0E8_9GAMM|nr:hypothetical protein [Salinisphaera sp. W335]MDT0635042.1 hypothetical protein [Salinisphaera sp. W335]
MSYPAVSPFDFHKNGDANRREDDAEPRVKLMGFDLGTFEAHVHVAGDTHVRAVPLTTLRLDDPIILGMAPADAFLAGGWTEQALQGPLSDRQTGEST